MSQLSFGKVLGAVRYSTAVMRHASYSGTATCKSCKQNNNGLVNSRKATINCLARSFLWILMQIMISQVMMTINVQSCGARCAAHGRAKRNRCPLDGPPSIALLQMCEINRCILIDKYIDIDNIGKQFHISCNRTVVYSFYTLLDSSYDNNSIFITVVHYYALNT